MWRAKGTPFLSYLGRSQAASCSSAALGSSLRFPEVSWQRNTSCLVALWTRALSSTAPSISAYTFSGRIRHGLSQKILQMISPSPTSTSVEDRAFQLFLRLGCIRKTQGKVEVPGIVPQQCSQVTTCRLLQNTFTGLARQNRLKGSKRTANPTALLVIGRIATECRCRLSVARRTPNRNR